METGPPPSPHSRAAPARWHAGPGRTADPGCATAVAVGAGLRADRSRSACARARCRRIARGIPVRTRCATNPKPARPYLIYMGQSRMGEPHPHPEHLWRNPEPRRAYDVVIVGAGGHGLATAYYLAKNHGITNVAVLERGWLAGGNMAPETTGVCFHSLSGRSPAPSDPPPQRG